jgi:alkylation response protein AidB-like acyl-CoA dehydrogenase
LSKWHASESAQRIAWWALESLGPSATLREDGPGGLVAAAYCTAPGLTISGGASETLLDTLAVSQLDRLGGPGDLDPVQGDLACCVREALARKGCLWERLADLGLLGFGLPLEVGGLNLGSAAETVVGRELGQALEPLPGYRETAVAAAVLAIAGAPRDDIMAAVLAGRCRIAPIGLYGAPRLELDGRGRLQGCSDPLPDATWQAVVARARRPGGEALLFLPLPDSGCGVQPVETLAGPAVRLRFEAADRAVVLASASLDAVLERPLAAGRVRQAALLLGIAEAAIVAARDHAGRRRQFGRRLLDFQSVSHRLAGLAAELEGITLLVQEAGWRCDADRSPGPSSTQALAAAAELALAATRLAVQLHGARGMVVGGLAERAYRLAAVEAVRLGRPGALWREAGSRRYDSLPDL